MSVSISSPNFHTRPEKARIGSALRLFVPKAGFSDSSAFSSKAPVLQPLPVSFFSEFASDIPSHGSIGRSFRADMEDGRLDFIPVILIVIRKEYFALSCLCLIRWIGALIEENTACIHDVLDISKVSGLLYTSAVAGATERRTPSDTCSPRMMSAACLISSRKPPCAPPMKTAEIGIRPFWLISFPSWMTTEERTGSGYGIPARFLSQKPCIRRLFLRPCT